MHTSEPGSLLDRLKIAVAVLLIVSFLASIGFAIAGFISATRALNHSSTVSFSDVLWHNAHRFVVATLICRGIFFVSLLVLVAVAIHEDYYMKSPKE